MFKAAKVHYFSSINIIFQQKIAFLAINLPRARYFISKISKIGRKHEK
jgi:hypothetical protein